MQGETRLKNFILRVADLEYQTIVLMFRDLKVGKISALSPFFEFDISSPISMNIWSMTF